MEMTNKIEDKQILTGEPCHETMVERFVVLENGSIQKEEVKVEVDPMMDLRRRILQEHEDKHRMRCHPSTYSAYSTMERCQLEKELPGMGEEVSDEATQLELADRLYRYHHTRHLFLPNDHADVAGASYMMEVVQVMYDTALYLSDEEYEEQHGNRVNIQSMVERPYIRTLTKSAGGKEA